MKTETIKCGTATYKIRELLFGQRNAIKDESTGIDALTGSARLRMGRVRHLTVKLGVVEPVLTDEDVNNLSEADGQKLYLAIQRLSKIPLGNLPSSS